MEISNINDIYKTFIQGDINFINEIYVSKLTDDKIDILGDYLIKNNWGPSNSKNEIYHRLPKESIMIEKYIDIPNNLWIAMRMKFFGYV